MNELATIDSTYGTIRQVAQSGWQVTEVDWPAFSSFHSAVKLLDSVLQEHDLSEQWEVFLSFCRRYRFFLTTNPLSAPVLTQELMTWRTAKSPSLGALIRGAPTQVVAASTAVHDAFQDLQSESENPLWKSAIDDVLSREHEDCWIAVLSTEARLAGPIATFLEAQNSENIGFWPVRPTDLKRANELYSQLLVFGPTSRHTRDGTDFLFKSPRAGVATLFTPTVFPASIPSPYDLFGSPVNDRSKEPSQSGVFARPTIRRTQESSPLLLPGEELEPNSQEEEWRKSLPTLHFTYDDFVRRAGDQRDFGERVPAKQILLSSDHVVYLDNSGSASHLVVAMDPDSGCRICEDVQHLEVASLGPDDAVLFSAEGGGDMVSQVADTILGDDVERLRSLQAEWKEALAWRVALHGLEGVAESLRAKGSRLARAINVRNWCSSMNIGPGTWQSFDAVLSYCGLEDRRVEFFEATKRLRSAHKSAGFQLAGRLRAQMKGRPLDELFSKGKQTFGGSKGLPNRKVAFLVLEVASDTVDVSPYDLQRPVEIESKSWR